LRRKQQNGKTRFVKHKEKNAARVIVWSTTKPHSGFHSGGEVAKTNHSYTYFPVDGKRGWNKELTSNPPKAVVVFPHS